MALLAPKNAAMTCLTAAAAAVAAAWRAFPSEAKWWRWQQTTLWVTSTAPGKGCDGVAEGLRFVPQHPRHGCCCCCCSAEGRGEQRGHCPGDCPRRCCCRHSCCACPGVIDVLALQQMARTAAAAAVWLLAMRCAPVHSAAGAMQTAVERRATLAPARSCAAAPAVKRWRVTATVTAIAAHWRGCGPQQCPQPRACVQCQARA